MLRDDLKALRAANTHTLAERLAFERYLVNYIGDQEVAEHYYALAARWY
jgi:hypothetical protein